VRSHALTVGVVLTLETVDGSCECDREGKKVLIELCESGIFSAFYVQILQKEKWLS
jgi:hypothetical protein